MAESSTPDELLAAASAAFRGDRTEVRAIVLDAGRRVSERTGEDLRTRVDAILSGAPQPGPAAGRPIAIGRPQPIPRLQPDWPIVVRSQGGRRVRATFAPAVARRRDLAALGRVSAVNDRRAFAELRHLSQALAGLTRSHDELAQKVAALQEQADRSLVGLVQGLADFKAQLEQVSVQGRRVVTRARLTRAAVVRQQREVRSLATLGRIQQVTAVVNSAQVAAYGQKGSVLAANNLLLAANQLFWTFLDPLLRSLGFVSGTSVSAAAWLAPLGSLAGGQMALANRQHIRFISGVASFEGGASIVRVSLRGRIADALWPEFQRRTDVLVTAVPLDPIAGGIEARVRNGLLEISLAGVIPLVLLPAPPPRRVAWMVDTGADVG